VTRPDGGLRTLLAVQSEVARVLTSTPRTEATLTVLELIGDALGCPVAIAWGVNRAGDRIRRVADWSRPDPPLEQFLEATRQLDFASGEGLPGQAWATGRTCWIRDLRSRPDWPRAAQWAQAGLCAGVSFPIIGSHGTGGVIEFYSPQLDAPSDDLLATLDALGRHIGQWTDRLHFEAQIRDRQARHTAILSSALDGIITIDAAGLVLEFNEAAQQMFGFRQEDALGRELADLIVPERLRESHRHGLARVISTNQPTILGQRIETVGCRADGQEFPVELTIARLPVPGSPVFTGHMRDITERVSAAQELRASRVRIVESADAERQRIQRNLHDGAQQRLTTLAISLGQVRQRLPADAQAADQLLTECEQEVDAAIHELRILSRGMHPQVLHDLGLAAAIRDLARRCPLDVAVHLGLIAGVPAMVEAGAYYTVAEALTNTVRHAAATRVSVSISLDDEAGGQLRVTVSDDGRGGARPGAGSGLRGLGDRVSALGGRLDIQSPAGGGTTLVATLPASEIQVS
jgi:PAS domain S-box-containing protein